VPVLSLGVVEEAAEERVGGVFRAPTKRTRSGPTYTGKHPATAGDDRARPAVLIWFKFSPDLHRSRVLEIRLFLVAPLLGATMPRTC